ncbi:hypothetical protein Tco_0541408 [Tanacetum coccineum]
MSSSAWFLRSLVLRLLAESKKEHRQLAPRCKFETNSGVRLLQNSSDDSGPDLSFDKSVSPKRLFSSARVSLAEATKPDLSFECSGGDYTSSCPPSIV